MIAGPYRIKSKFMFTLVTILTIIFFCSVGRKFYSNNKNILNPVFVTSISFSVFVDLLRNRVTKNIFGEIGFLYLFFAVIYTLAPAYGFLTLESLSSGSGFQNLALLLPDQIDLGRHLWRHWIFIASFSIAYLIYRGCESPSLTKTDPDLDLIHKRIIFILLVVVLASIALMSLLSAPVKSYIDNYTRYDHLPWLVRRFVTFCIVAKMGGAFVLLVIMFRYYKKYKIHIFIFIFIMSVYEIKNSFGSRIETFFLILAALILYHYYVKPVTFKLSLIAVVLFGILFSGIEVLRSSNFDMSTSKSTFTQKQGMPAGELGAVYFTSYHLYLERKNGNLPPVEWPMFFNDFISILPFVDQTRWHPMFWYAKNYFPESVVPPQTLSPIADSAIWGGEIDLIIRSFVNGMIFAWLMRWFCRKSKNWKVTTIYVFCCATCIMSLKYSIFFHLVPVIKIILPVMVMTMIAIKIFHKQAKLKANSSCSSS